MKPKPKKRKSKNSAIKSTGQFKVKYYTTTINLHIRPTVDAHILWQHPDDVNHNYPDSATVRADHFANMDILIFLMYRQFMYLAGYMPRYFWWEQNDTPRTMEWYHPGLNKDEKKWPYKINVPQEKKRK